MKVKFTKLISPALLILLAFISLAVIYSLVTPPLEAGDESRHYAVVKYIAETGRLPIQNQPQTQSYQRHWSHEGNQPPLYYALAAALTFWIDTGSWDETFWYNPHTTIGNPLQPDNKNITIHPPAESWPWRGHVLAVHLIRFMSIAMAAVTVATAYVIALRLFRGNRWLACGAMAITAFNPMFIFISAAVNNDNAVIMFITLALYLLIRLAESANHSRMSEHGTAKEPIPNTESTDEPAPNEPMTNQQPPIEPMTNAESTYPFPISPSPHLPISLAPPPLHPPALRSIALLGLLIGLGALSKLYAFGLLPLAILLFLWLAYQNTAATSSHPGQQSPTLSLAPLLPCSLAPLLSTPLSRFTFYVLRFTFHVSRSTFYRLFLTWTALLLLVFLAVAGWFYLRNALLYDGDVLALQVMRETAGQRRELPSLATLRAEFEGFRIAYWALFGGVNILVANWIYTLLDLISLLALLGLIGFLILDFGFWIFKTLKHQPSLTPNHHPLPTTRHAPPFTFHVLRFTFYASRFTSSPALLLLLAWTLIMLAGFVVWNLTQPAGQGRLLYPAIAALSALGTLGLTWWLPSLAQKALVSLCAAALFLFAALVPGLYIAPTYAKPALLAEADLPAGLEPVDFIYDDTIRLIGYQRHTPVVRPAERLSLTLYWQLLRPVDQDYSIFIHLLGRQRQVVGQLDTYPGGGAWPTRLLPPGAILADHYQVPIPPEAEQAQAPTRLQIAAGIYDFFEPGRPGRPVVSAAGQPVEPIIGSAKLIPWQWPDPPQMAQPVNFFDKATLLSYHLDGDHRSLTLNWRAGGQFETDYTVFIQLWRLLTPPDENVAPASTGPAEYVAGFDGPPVNGDYPTSFWSPGEIIIDTHALELSRFPPGDYKLLVGLYNPNTGDRLPAFNPDGPLPDYAVNLGTLSLPK